MARRPERVEESVETLRRYFDAVLVHGDPTLIPFETTFPAADRIADLIRYTGYVAAAPAKVEPHDGYGDVMVSAGGGAVGAPLLFAANGRAADDHACPPPLAFPHRAQSPRRRL